jgi:hypothetical protein
VRSFDRGWDSLKKAMLLEKHGASYVKVGVLGGAKNERTPANTVRQSDNTVHTGRDFTNVELAVIHEYGAPAAGIPERSFLRSTFFGGRPTYIAMLRVLLKKVYEQKMELKRALGLVGSKIAGDVKRRITQGAGIPPPLKSATIARKGSSRPLVDTGQLKNSITWEVVMNKRPEGSGPGDAD